MRLSSLQFGAAHLQPSPLRSMLHICSYRRCARCCTFAAIDVVLDAAHLQLSTLHSMLHFCSYRRCARCCTFTAIDVALDAALLQLSPLHSMQVSFSLFADGLHLCRIAAAISAAVSCAVAAHLVASRRACSLLVLLPCPKMVFTIKFTSLFEDGLHHKVCHLRD